MESFYRNKRVFVTGHTGFKGSWLTLWLTEMGAQVTGYALDPTGEVNLFSSLQLSTSICDNRGDIGDLSKLSAAIKAARPDIVFHLAAQPLVKESYAQPVTTYATNVLGTVHVLEAIRQAKLARCAVVNVTTDKVYENKEWIHPFRETDRLGGDDPYSSSKACAELVTHSYRTSFFTGTGLGLASARAGNVIGGGDWAQDRLLPDIIRACQSGETLTLRNTQSIRPWQHVLEPLSGYLMLAKHLYESPETFSDCYNFGPAPEAFETVGSVVERVLAEWGIPPPVQIIPSPHHEANLLKLDCEKARQKLKWFGRYCLDDALHHTVAWYRAFYGGHDMRSLSQQQIHQYKSYTSLTRASV